MAKYDVNFSCGHKEQRELFGKSVDRQKKITYWEEYGICSECYKEQNRIDVEIEAEKAGFCGSDEYLESGRKAAGKHL